jgi:hypothetical protein
LAKELECKLYSPSKFTLVVGLEEEMIQISVNQDLENLDVSLKSRIIIIDIQRLIATSFTIISTKGESTIRKAPMGLIIKTLRMEVTTEILYNLTKLRKKPLIKVLL